MYKQDLVLNNRHCAIGWDSRIHQLLLCRGVKLPNECKYMTLNSLMVRFQ